MGTTNRRIHRIGALVVMGLIAWGAAISHGIEANGWTAVPLYRPLPAVEQFFEEQQSLFDPATALKAWTVAAGDQNAQSRLTVTEGDRVAGGKVLKWEMTFSGGKQLEYGEAVIGAAIEKPGLGFGLWVKEGPDAPRMSWRIRVVDSSGEFHQYDLMRRRQDGWSYFGAELGQAQGVWGGDGNRRLDYPCKLHSLLVDKPAEGWKGTVFHLIDRMSLVKRTVRKDAELPFKVLARNPPLGHVHAPGETVALRFEAPRGAFDWRLADHDGKELAAGKGEKPGTPISAKLPQAGYYVFQVTWRDGTESEQVEYRCAALPADAPRNGFVAASVHFMRPWWPFEALALLPRYGITQMRDEIGWDEVEQKPGQFAMPEHCLKVLRRARELGIDPLLILDYGNRNYENGGFPVKSEHIEAFVRYSDFMARSTQGFCNAFEMWNEWCGGCGMSGKTGPNTPEAYATFARAVYPAVKKARPDATLIGVGGEPAKGPTVERMFRAGLGSYTDAWSVHPYRWSQSPEMTALASEVESCIATACAAGAPPPSYRVEASRTVPPKGDFAVTDFGAVADGKTLNTAAIQKAIDACAEKGGGTVRIPKGTFLCGGLHLKSRVALRLEKDAILLGSTDCMDYGKGQWTDAFLTGTDLQGVRIEGEGTIDGADCRNPKGEEGFRGPHGILLRKCRDIYIGGITIVRSANWAINCYNCENATFEDFKVRGGHDGIDAQECVGFEVRKCDFRTGDDCIAGPGNRDFLFEDCYFNTSCNGFRFSCVNMTVRNSRFKGPGEFEHKISNRHNMISAFVHFSPMDRGYKGPQVHSDRWLIENCTIENVDRLYEFNHEKGLWQKGRPVGSVAFKDVKATGLVQPVFIVGDVDHQFSMRMENVALTPRDERAEMELISARRFDTLTLRNVALKNSGKKPVLKCEDGKTVSLSAVRCVPENPAPYVLTTIGSVLKDGEAPGESKQPLGAPPRVWITEIGWTTPPGGDGVTELEQAWLTVRGLALLQSIPQIEKVYLYDFIEDGTHPVDIEHHFGLMLNWTLGLQPKPAGPAVAAFSRLTAGAKCTGRWQEGDLHAVRYQTPEGKDLLMAWSSDKPGEVTVSGTVSAVYDLMGNPLSVANRCKLNGAPVYLSGQSLKLQPAK
jgi:hypothetical protein